jgi:hypothetical protein
MKNVEVTFAKPVLNLMVQLADGNMDFCDSIAKVQIVGLKGAAGEALEVSPAELVGMEGRNSRLQATGEAPGYGKFSIEVDSQTGIAKLCGQPELNDLTLVLGVETENLNRRPA